MSPLTPSSPTVDPEIDNISSHSHNERDNLLHATDLTHHASPGASAASGSESDSTHSKLSVKEAKEHGKNLVWRRGEASLEKTSVKDMAGLGIGFQLYFRLLSHLFLLFLLLTLLSLPSYLANFSGVSTPLTDIDSLSFALFTLGNQGNPCETNHESIFGSCPNLDCNNTSKRCLLGSIWSVEDIATMLGVFEVLIVLVLIWFVEKFLREEVEYFKKTREKMVPSAARYTVMVKGLPPDVTEKEVTEFFNNNYDLSSSHPSFPIFGLSEAGCLKILFWTTFTLSSLISIGHFAHSNSNLTHALLVESGFGYFDGRVKDFMNVVFLTFISFCVASVAKGIGGWYKVGKQVDRATPQEIYEARIEKMKEYEKEGKAKGDKRKVYAAPEEDLLAVEDADDSRPDVENPVDPDLPKCPWEEFYDEINENYYYYNATSGESVWERPIEFFYNEQQPQSTDGGAGDEKKKKKKFQPLKVSLPVMKRRNHDPDNDTHAYACDYVGKWITEVSLIKNAGRVIRSFREKKSLLDRIEMQRQKVLKFTDLHKEHVEKDEEQIEKNKNNPLSAPPSKTSSFEKKKNKAWKDLQDLHNKMEDLQWGISNGTNPKHIAESCGAFVTFEHEESKIRCLDDYRYCKNYLVRFFQPSHLRFKRTNYLTGEEEEYKLLVVRAPEPSELMWENLEYAHNTKLLARFKSNMMTFGLLLMSFLLIFLAYQQKAIFEKNLLDFDFCTDELPSIYWGSHEDLPEFLDLVRDKSKDNGAAGGCPKDYFHITFANETIKEQTLSEPSSLPKLLVPANDTHPESYMSRAKFENSTGLQLCDGACHPKMADNNNCPVLATGISSYNCEDYSCSLYTPTYPAACYCFQRMNQEFSKNGYGWDTLSRLEEEEGDLCYSIFTEYVLARSFAAGATGVIVVVNFVLKELIPRFAASEHHSSSTGEVKGVFMKVSMAQVVNTAVSTIVANAKIAWSDSINPAYDSEIEDNKHADFTKKWYATVGVSLTLTMFVNALSPHLAQLAGWAVAPVARAWKRRKVNNQKQLNELYEGARFRMETRLTTAFQSMMKVAVVCHICVALYMLGNADILKTDTVEFGVGEGRRALSGEETTSSLYSRIFQTHVFPLLTVGAVYVSGNVLFTIFDPGMIKQAVQLVVTGKPPANRYYAPGYNSTFHSLLTEDQIKQVQEKGDLSEMEKAKGYRLNKNNKHLVNRVDKDDNLLLTWEVAKADGLLHTYNLEKNVNYSGEVKFLNSFLANFGGVLATKVSADSTGKIHFDEHERQMRSMQANMLTKVQVADALVEKAKEDVKIKMGVLVANKWINKIEMKKEAVKRASVMEQLKDNKGRSVFKAFEFNLALARLRREKEVVESELGRYLCERAMESIVDEVVLREGGEGVGRVGLLEKMVSAKGQDLEKYKVMFEEERKKREGGAAISILKIAAVKETARVRSEVGKVVWGLVESVVDLSRVEEEEEEEERVGVEVVKYVEVEVKESKKAAVTEARIMTREVVAGVVFGVVGKIVRNKMKAEREKREKEEAPRTPRIVVNMPQILVSPPLKLVNNSLSGTPTPPSPPEEIIKAVMKYVISNVEVTEYKRQVDYIKASVMFEKEVRKQKRREEKRLLKEREKEKERALLAHTLPRDFFGADFGAVDFFVRSQEDLDRAEVALALKDVVMEVVEVGETLELRASLKVLEEEREKAHVNTPEERSSRGSSPVQEVRVEREVAESFTASLLFGAVVEDAPGVEEGIKFKARVVEELGKRKRVILIQRAARAWLGVRNDAARVIVRAIRGWGVGLLRKKLVNSTKKEKQLEQEVEKMRLEGVKRVIDFEGEKAEGFRVLEEEWKDRVVGLEKGFDLKEVELNEKLRGVMELLEEKELKEAEEKLKREKLAKEKQILEGLLSAAEEEDEVESKIRVVREGYEKEKEGIRAELEAERRVLVEEKRKLEEEMGVRVRDLEEESRRKVGEIAREKRRVEEESTRKIEEIEREAKRVEEESEVVEKKRMETEKRLGETLDILQKKETDLFTKIKEVNKANSMLVDVQRVVGDKEAVVKESTKQVKESIVEATTLKMKLNEAELRLSEMKGRSNELEARVESMKVAGDLKGTFDLLTQQLAAANDERESILSERLKDHERGRSEIEIEIMQQRKEMERARKEDQEKMDEKVAELMRVVEELKKDKEAQAAAKLVAEEEALKEKEEEEEEEEGGGPAVIEDSFDNNNNVSVGGMVDSSLVEEREREIEGLQEEVERMKAVMQGHLDTEGQLKKALRRIISMKQKSTQAKGFYEHKIKEAVEEKGKVVEELEGLMEEKVGVEEELKAAQEVVMGMEQEADDNKAKFMKVLGEMKDREVKVAAAKKEAERLKREIADMKKKEEKKKGEVDRQLGRLRRQIKDGVGLASLVESKEEVIQDLKLELQREQFARKTAYNTLQDMQGKIRVIVRCRPLVSSEREKGSRGIVKLADEVSLQIMGDKGKALEFGFDGVLGSKVRQEGVFEKAKGMIGSVIDGFNATIFAYGQTGSGKTYSMAGEAGGGGEDEGIIPRSARELFNMLEARSEFYEYSVSCYFVELYINKLNDLFLEESGRKPIHHVADKLEVKLDASRMVYVKNATVKEIEDSEELIDAWAGGEQLRNVTSTKMNDRSSRSHSILSIIVETKSKTTGATTRAKLSLIDLAGSERVKKSGVVGTGMAEAQSINKSLTCLSDVINALSNESKFVPYRNNTLTQLMQDSLGGNAKTVMLVAISPAEFNREETTMSLHYASRARMIKNKSVKGQGTVGSLEEVKRLRGLIEEMRREKREREEEEVKGPA